MHPVRIEPSARQDIARHYRYLRRHPHSPAYPDEWFDAVQEAILSLGDQPLRFPLAPENDAFEEEIRHRIVGSYRVLFTIQKERVHVLHVHMAARTCCGPGAEYRELARAAPPPSRSRGSISVFCGGGHRVSAGFRSPTLIAGFVRIWQSGAFGDRPGHELG